jgi:uroporphyrinogen-III synthase
MLRKKNIVIFRAAGPVNNIYLSKELGVLKYKVITSPILRVKKIYNKKIIIKPNDIVITTSFFGIYYLSILTLDRKFKLYCLGKASNLLAKRLGFKNVIECSGDSANMFAHFNYYKKCLKIIKGGIIYVGAKEISYDLPKKFEDLGFKVKRYKVYSSDAVNTFSRNFISLIKNKKVSWIILLSAKGAKTFYKNSKMYFNKEDLVNIKFACISSNVAKQLKAKYLKTFCPKTPNIDCIKKIILKNEGNHGT